MWIIRGPIKPFIFSLFHLLHPDHPEQPDQSDHRFWLIKRIIKKIHEEPGLVTLSCLIELQFGVNIESFSCQQKIKLFFTWYGQSGLKLQQKWSYLVKQIVMYLITWGNQLILLVILHLVWTVWSAITTSTYWPTSAITAGQWGRRRTTGSGWTWCQVQMSILIFL